MAKYFARVGILFCVLIAGISFPTLASEADGVALQELAGNFLGPGFLEEGKNMGGKPRFCMRIGNDWYVTLNGVKRRIVEPEGRSIILGIAPWLWISKDGKRIVLCATEEGYLMMRFMVEQKSIKGLTYKLIYDGQAQMYPW